MPRAVRGPIGKPGGLEQWTPHALVERLVTADPSKAVRKDQLPGFRHPLLEPGLKVHRLKVTPQSREHARRHLDPASVAVLARLNALHGIRPCAPDVQSLAGPVDVASPQGRRLAPARAPPERDHQERPPPWLQLAARIEQAPHLIASEPLEILGASPRAWLTDEEAEIR